MSLMDKLMDNGEEITLFGDGEIYQSPEYTKITREVSALRKRIMLYGGQGLEKLLDEYTEAVESKEDLVAEHYFEQGFLAGRRETKKERD